MQKDYSPPDPLVAENASKSKLPCPYSPFIRVQRELFVILRRRLLLRPITSLGSCGPFLILHHINFPSMLALSDFCLLLYLS